jgi:uncharacterized protein
MGNFTEQEQKILRDIADASIRNGFANHKPLDVNFTDYPQKLCELGACFVTLEIHNVLRGCIGSLEAYRPLILDVAQNAYLAAFKDPRFHSLTYDEYKLITMKISVLTKPVPIYFSSEANLLEQLKPGIDGLILTNNGRRGTFLPAVWESLTEPKVFLEHLKMKAGFPADYWSDTIVVERYTAEII